MNVKNWNWRVIVGGLLIAAGILFFLQEFLYIKLGDVFLGLLFAGGGALFLAALVRNPKGNWWAAIPGTILIFLGLMILFNNIIPGFERFGGTFFLGGIGLAFVLVYLIQPTFWWAIIPAGTLLTLAVVAAISDNGIAWGGVLFLGLGATFGLLGVLPVGREMKWPFIPAAILGLMGVLLMMGSGSVFNYIWPVILIGAGLYVLLRSFMKQK